ncbi:MAG: hypothetical protein KY464_09705, partial [Gemmatimonadetes bacterium]|nr:hypothetical protein [Gemmatimonadota bacterium]
MSGAADPLRADVLRRAARIAALSVVGVALLVLFGWWLDVELLKSLYATVAMNPLTAVCFIVTGGSLWLMASRLEPLARRRRRRVGG